MKALAYLLITQLKNRILALKKKPALLILYLLIVLMLIFMVAMSIIFKVETTRVKMADERIMYLILGGIGLLFLGLYVNTGLSTGSTLFSMADVGLLFVAPISSKKILLYGLITTLGKTILASVFILFQITNLNTNFGYGILEILALFFIYVVVTIFGQLMSIATYIYTNGNPKRKNIVRMGIYLSAGICLLVFLAYQKNMQLGMFETALTIVDSSWFGYIPMGGWMVLFFKGITEGAIFDVLISLTLFGIFSVLFMLLLTSGPSDYYEDVLHSTEITHQKLIAVKENKYAQLKKKNVKVKEHEEGLLKGKGAAVLAYKNRLEMKRRSRFAYVDSYTIIVSIGVGIVGYNINGNAGLSYGILSALLYLQFFITTFGPLRFELQKHYIYLIPEKSIAKIFAASLNSIIKPCVDGIAIFGVFAITGGCDILTAIFLALAYAAGSALFIGLTILYQRVFGAQPNMIAKAIVGFILLAIVLTPSIISSVIFITILPEDFLFLGMLPFTLCCVAFTALIFLICGNMLDRMDFAGK